MKTISKKKPTGGPATSADVPLNAKPLFSKKLNNAQLELLRLFSRKMSKAEMEALRKTLVDFYDKLVSDEVDRAMAKKGLIQRDLDNFLNTHPKRTPYR